MAVVARRASGGRCHVAQAGDVPKRTTRLLKHALGLPGAAVKNASRGRKARLTAGCAADIRRAADRVRGDLGG